MSIIEQIESDSEVMALIIRACPSEHRMQLYSTLAKKLRAQSLNFQAAHFEILTISEERGKQPTFIG